MKNMKLYLKLSIFYSNSTFVLVMINSKLVLDWVGQPRLENLQFDFQIKCDQVMFLHLSVSQSVHRRGVWTGGCISQHETPPGQAPSRQTPPGRHTPWQTHPQADTPSSWRSLQRTVRILLECILVIIVIFDVH